MTNDEMTGAKPWWKHGLVWLVISGPAVVAARGADPVVETDYYRRGIEINKTLAAHGKSRLPALQGRNHAAMPAEP